jgi:ABC-type enterochelin transport system substrate-binding protein
VAGALHRQDGFVREVLWLAFIVAVVALVLLDVMALVNANQSVRESAAAATLAASSTYAETQNVPSAKQAAKASLAQNGKELIGLDTSRSLDGALVFNVTAQGHADTYAFKYLGYVGLKSWVDRMTNPTATKP